MVLGQVRAKNDWIGFCSRLIQFRLFYMVLGYVRLGQFAKRLGSIQDDDNDISDALLAAQSINNRSVTLCSVRLVRQMIGLSSVHGEFCSGSFTWCQVGQVSSPNVKMDSVQDDVTDISDELLTAQSINKRSVTRCQVRLGQDVLGQFSFPNVWILFTMTSLTIAMCW